MTKIGKSIKKVIYIYICIVFFIKFCCVIKKIGLKFRLGSVFLNRFKNGFNHFFTTLRQTVDERFENRVEGAGGFPSATAERRKIFKTATGGRQSFRDVAPSNVMPFTVSADGLRTRPSSRRSSDREPVAGRWRGRERE